MNCPSLLSLAMSSSLMVWSLAVSGSHMPPFSVAKMRLHAPGSHIGAQRPGYVAPIPSAKFCVVDHNFPSVHFARRGEVGPSAPARERISHMMRKI